MTNENFFSRAVSKVIGAAFELMLSPFPNTVRIETTNACNSKCAICPHGIMKRPVMQMEGHIFKKIVDECALHNCGEIHMHNFGEPLLDKYLESKIKYAKDKGIKKVKIFSNGSLLTSDRVNGLIEAGLDEIKISFDGASKEEFEKIRRPLKFETIIENIKEMTRIKKAKNSHLKISVACCAVSNKSKTISILENMVDDFSFGKVHNWSDKDYTHEKGKIRKPCSRVWRTFTILSNGEVSLCCLDYDGKVKLGRIDEGNSIADVWRGDEYKKIRNLHKNARQNEISLCDNCTKSFF